MAEIRSLDLSQATERLIERNGDKTAPTLAVYRADISAPINKFASAPTFACAVQVDQEWRPNGHQRGCWRKRWNFVGVAHRHKPTPLNPERHFSLSLRTREVKALIVSQFCGVLSTRQ